MFLAPTTFCRRIIRALVFLNAVSAWSGMIGLLREPDYWIPWDILSSIFVMLRGGGPSSQSIRVVRRTGRTVSFFQHFCSLVLFEENGFITFPSLPQGCRGFDFVISPKFHFFGACPHPNQDECFCRPGVSGISCFKLDRGSRLLRFHFPRDVWFPSDSPFSYKGHC